MLVVGVDVGGTKVAAGLVNECAQVQTSCVLPTRAQEGYNTSIAQVFAAIDKCLTPEVTAIGICAPGPLNPKTGLVINPPNLPGWMDIPLSRMMFERYGIPCVLENDANAAGFAEVRFGAAKGLSNVVYATLGTGVGTGIILGGKIYHGRNGAAGEGGHVSIDYRSSAICNCGTPGCIEAIASGTALRGRGIDPSEMTDELLDEIGIALGAWLGSLVNLLDPEMVVIGGGISRIGEPLFSRIQREMPRRTINWSASPTPIVPAMLQENCGIIGAAAVALDVMWNEVSMGRASTADRKEL